MNIRIGVDSHREIYNKMDGGERGGGFFLKNERERDKGIKTLPQTLIF